MSYDFINQLGVLGLPARLKRLGEAINQSNRQLYKFFDFEIEPTWMLIFKLLEKYEQLTVTEIAAKLHFAHPTIITMVGNIQRAGFLNSSRDGSDKRKQFYSLSAKALDRMTDWNRIWEANEKAIVGMIHDQTNLLKELEHIEIQLTQKSLKDRIIEELNQEKNVI